MSSALLIDNSPRLSPDDSGFEFWQVQVNDQERQFGWRIRLAVMHFNKAPSKAKVQFAYFNRYNPEKENRLLTQNFEAEHFEINNGKDGSFEFRAGNIVLSDEYSQGVLSTFEETVRWKLAWFNDPDSGFQHWPGDRFYRWKHPQTKMLTPVPRSMIDGKISVGALDVDLEEAYGHLSHWWGTDFPQEWHRAHCTAFEETDFASLEMYEVRLKSWLPTLTLIQLELFGELLAFNSLHQMIRNASHPGQNSWIVAAENPTHRLQAELQYVPESLETSEYILSGDIHRSAQFTGIASMQVLLSEKIDGKWHLHKKLTCRDAASYEHGTSEKPAD